MKIIISFDDASVQDMEVAKIIDRYGLSDNTTFFFPVMPTMVNEPRGRRSLTPDQTEDIASRFEIGSHTITHQLLTRIPLDSARAEIFDSKNLLEERFERPITQFSYPRGYTNPDLQKMVQDAGYLSARSTLVGYIHESENPYFQQTTVHVGCDRKEYGGKTWMEYADSMLELARTTPRSIFSLFGHGYELASYPEGLTLFENLLRKLV